MNAFTEACEVEKLAEADLLPYMENVWPDLTYYPTRHHKLVQKVCGDLLVTREGRAKYVEIKAEAENLHGNLFIEVWSNRSRHTRGWLYTCHADWLWYYFLTSRELCVCPMGVLRRWAFSGATSRIEAFPLKSQSKYVQLNDTWGHCVPIPVLQSECEEFRGPILVPVY